MTSPTFGQLPDGPSTFLREWMRAGGILFILLWLTLPLLFAPPPRQIHVRPFAFPGQSCQDWRPILNGRERLPDFLKPWFIDPAVITEPCTQLTDKDPSPMEHPQRYIENLDGIAILDPSLSQCGSDEASSGGIRYLMIMCSPLPTTYDALSW